MSNSLNTDSRLYDLAADLVQEICSYLAVHDQSNMKRICRWWRLNLSEACLSRLVQVDGSSMPKQSETLLKHAIKMHVQKNTKILVLRHISFQARRNTFGSIAKSIQQTRANLIQLILMDCSVQEEFAGVAYCWLHPEKLTDYMQQRLISATKKLILVRYTMWNALGGVMLNLLNIEMPRSASSFEVGDIWRKLPVVLPRLEFDCSQPFVQHYHAFIMAVNFCCPEVSPEVRKDVVQLYNSWMHSDTEEYQLESVGRLIKSLNEGVPVDLSDEDLHVDVPALRQLDPLTLNTVTMEALHRMYF